MTFDISIDRVQKFYESLGKCIEQWNTTAKEELQAQKIEVGDQHPDQVFFDEKHKHIDTSIHYWLTEIPARMARQEISQFSSPFNPFVCAESYTANHVWFELAFDIQKKLQNPKKTWFSICFPSLNTWDPITFRSLLHVMPSHVYVVKQLFTTSKSLSDIVIPKFLLCDETTIESPLFSSRGDIEGDGDIESDGDIGSESSLFSSNDNTASSGLGLSIELPSRYPWPSESDMTKIYFPRAYSPNPCYVFEEKTNQLYAFVPDKNPAFSDEGLMVTALISIDTFYKHDFVKRLLTLLETARRCMALKIHSDDEKISLSETDSFTPKSKNLLSSISEDMIETIMTNDESIGFYGMDVLREDREQTCYVLDSRDIEALVTDYGGYPNFDLRRFTLKNDFKDSPHSVVYFLDSMLYPRRELNAYCAEDDTVSQSIKQRHRAGEIIVSSTTKGYPYYAAMYAKKEDTSPAPLTLIDLNNIVWKRNPLFFYQGQTLYAYPEDYLSDVLMPIWQNRGRIPTLILPRLLKAFIVYFELLDEEDSSPQAFRDLLNQWSADTWHDQPRSYPWNEDELNDRLFLYTQDVLMIDESSDLSEKKSTFLQLLLNCLYDPLEQIYGDVLSLARWVTNYAPHLISDHPGFEPIYENLSVGPYFNVEKLIECLEKLKPTVDGHLFFLLRQLIYVLSTRYKDNLDSLSITTKELDNLKKIYAVHDQYVAVHSKYDHFNELNDDHASWRYLAEILSGAGWIGEPIQLLCPTIVNTREPNIGMLFDDFHPQSLILKKDRTELIALASSRLFLSYTPFFMNFNNPEFPQFFAFEEFMAIQKADSRYHAFGLNACIKIYGGESLSLSTCLMIRFLIQFILNPELIDDTHFVNERYKIVQVQNSNDLLMRRKKDKCFAFFSKSDSASKKNSNQSIIYVLLTKNGFECSIPDQGKNKEENVFISFDALGISTFKRRRISGENLKKYYFIILRYLERKEHIPHYYSTMMRDSCVQGEAIFSEFYENMPAEERRALNNRTVQIDDDKKTFKQILNFLPQSRVVASIFLIVLLISIDSEFTFNEKPSKPKVKKKLDFDDILAVKKKPDFGDILAMTQDSPPVKEKPPLKEEPPQITGAEKKLEDLLPRWRAISFNLPYKNIRYDIALFLISLMTFDFAKNLPDDETLTDELFLEDIVCHGCTNRIPGAFLNMFFLIAGEDDLKKQEKIYINEVRNTLYYRFYQDRTEYKAESYLGIKKNINQWVSLIIKNRLRYFVNIREYDWLQKVCLNIKRNSLHLNMELSDKFAGFQSTLHTDAVWLLNAKNSDEPDVIRVYDLSVSCLKANLKYIYFLRALSVEDFFIFWHEINEAYRKEVLIDYVARFNCCREDYSLAWEAKELFADDLEDIPIKQSPYSFNEIFEHLMLKLENIAENKPARERTSSTPCF